MWRVNLRPVSYRMKIAAYLLGVVIVLGSSGWAHGNRMNHGCVNDYRNSSHAPDLREVRGFGVGYSGLAMP